MMKSRFYLFLFLVAALSLMVILQVPAQDTTQQQMEAKDKAMAEQKDIVDTAMAAGNFNTFLKAVEAAGLKETLKGAGPYTVFAPTDEAFAKLPADKLDALMKDQAKLKNILLAHVVSGSVMSKDAANLQTAKSLAGSDLKIQAAEGNVTIDNASVVQADVTATNGVIHAIDAVLMPATPATK